MEHVFAVTTRVYVIYYRFTNESNNFMICSIIKISSAFCVIQMWYGVTVYEFKVSFLFIKDMVKT